MKLNINEAIMKLEQGEVIGLETDTIIGLASEIDYQQKLYEIKNRPLAKKIIYFIYDIKQIPGLDQTDIELIQSYWPGNNTIIIDDQGYRIPNHADVIALLKQLNQPLAVTSANLSGEEHVKNFDEFMCVFPNLDYFTTGLDLSTNRASNIFLYDKVNKTFTQIR